MSLVDDGIDAVSWWVLPRHNAGSAWGTVGSTGVCLAEDDSFASESVGVRRLDEFVSGEPSVFPTHVVDEDEDEIRRSTGFSAR